MQCLEPLVFHIRQGLSQLGQHPVQELEHKLTHAAGSLKQQKVDWARACVDEIEEKKKSLVLTLHLDVARQETERLLRTNELLRRELVQAAGETTRLEAEAAGLAESLAARTMEAEQLRSTLEETEYDMGNQIADLRTSHQAKLEDLEAAHAQRVRDLEDRALHAEKNAALMEQRMVQKEEFLQEWKQMAAEQKGMESDRVQEQLRAMAEKEQLAEERLRDRVAGLEQRLVEEQRSRQDAQDRVRALESELRASSLEGQARVTALTAEVRAKERRMSLMEGELEAFHVTTGAARRSSYRAPALETHAEEDEGGEDIGPGSSGRAAAGLTGEKGGRKTGASRAKKGAGGKGAANTSGGVDKCLKGKRGGRGKKAPEPQDDRTGLAAMGEGTSDAQVAPSIDISQGYEPPASPEPLPTAGKTAPKKGAEKQLKGGTSASTKRARDEDQENEPRAAKKAAVEDAGAAQAKPAVGGVKLSQASAPGRKRALGKPAGALAKVDANRHTNITAKALGSAQGRGTGLSMSQPVTATEIEGTIAQARAPSAPRPSVVTLSQGAAKSGAFMFGGTFTVPKLAKKV